MGIDANAKYAVPTHIDDKGRLWEPFSIAYKYEGLEYSFEIMATGRADAEARVAAMAQAWVVGKLCLRVPEEEIDEYLVREQAKLN